MPGKHSSFCRLPGPTTLPSYCHNAFGSKNHHLSQKKTVFAQRANYETLPLSQRGEQETFPNPKKLIISSSLLSQDFTMK